MVPVFLMGYVEEQVTIFISQVRLYIEQKTNDRSLKFA